MSKTFKVTALVNLIIGLKPITGPAGTSVTVTGAGFDASSTITIKFDGQTIATTPSTVTIPLLDYSLLPSMYLHHRMEISTVGASQGSNSASETFTVTSGPINSTTTTSPSPNFSDKMILPDIFA